jgi:hypothetical protein
VDWPSLVAAGFSGLVLGRQMTLNEAIRVLMRAAARDAAGAGCGIRSLPSNEERSKIAEAMLRCGRRVEGDWYTLPMELRHLSRGGETDK